LTGFSREFARKKGHQPLTLAGPVDGLAKAPKGCIPLKPLSFSIASFHKNQPTIVKTSAGKESAYA